MCMMCDGMSAADVELHVTRQIAQDGYSVICVQDPNPKRVFGYTVGLTRVGQPEFLVRGLGQEKTMMALNGLAGRVLRGEYFAHGHTAEWIDERHVLYFAEKKGAGKYALGVYRRYGMAARVLEVHVVGREAVMRTCQRHRHQVLGIE